MSMADANNPAEKITRALDYVGQLRNDAILKVATPNQTSQAPDKELEVCCIGQSLEQRMERAMRVGEKASVSRYQKQFHDEDDNMTSRPVYNPTGRVNTKFLPIDIYKMTSVEVVALLEANIIYNKSNHFGFPYF
jgi:hypothetical protein